MTDTDLHQPDHGPLRAAAEAAELAQAASGLVRIDGRRLADSDPLAPLARDIARSMTEAGLTVHHCAQHDPLYRRGGVCLLAVPAESRTGSRIAVSWIAHNRLVLEWARYGTYAGTQQAVNTALGGMLRAFRLPDRAVRVRRRLARQRPPGNGGGTMTTLALPRTRGSATSMPLPRGSTVRSACPRRSPSLPWPGSRRTYHGLRRDYAQTGRRGSTGR
jgi:hypothetical protein